MPGLFGVLRRTSRVSPDVLGSMVDRMVAGMQTEPWLQAEVAVGDVYGGGRVSPRILAPEPQPLAAGRCVAWFDGEIYAGPTDTGRTPTAPELAGLVDASPAALATLDGAFSLACFDPDRAQLVLATDRMGLRPLYFSDTPDWFAYASEVKPLLAILDRTPPLDEIAARQFFSFDHLLGNRTWWKGIEVIPPGSIWRVSPTDRKERRYWTFDDIRYSPKPEPDLLEELHHLWSEAVRQRRKPGVTPLLLSGGLDSRSLLAELAHQGAPLTTFTFGEPECPDIRIARRCARLAAVPHQTLALDHLTWWRGREECIAATDGLLNAMHLSVAAARRAMSVGNRVSPIHVAGDSLFGGSYLADSWIPPGMGTDWRDHSRAIVARYYQANPFFTRDDVVGASAGDIALYLEGPSPDCLFYLQRQRRFILHGALALAPYCETTYPGLSLPLLNLLLGGASPEERKDSRLYARFLLAAYPAYFSRIRWQKTGGPLSQSARPLPLPRLIRRALNRVRRYSAAAWSRPFISYADLVRACDLQRRLRLEHLVVEDALGEPLTSRLASDALDARVLLGVVTLETYLRQTMRLPPLPASLGTPVQP